ncbi:hypothetical protein, variant 2 [Aphanomyces astaci]|uniref:NAD/GMP synthase domain-containing protein n=1 Tax=Aphanomyces astaci TaxID=112090 RepID=W4FI30_APHAT|nr:hypothetical protein, variant 2 [Aphanomyces astaci]ETV66481.1 hypothetical protein, variant 2 [Aphanomyces astaci]|eukprot:XP_009844008.1 hypothetical protein, variant 2 [Aphanomyces astaci]
MLDQLLARVRQAGSSKHVNIVAYSGGVDSSLVAALVHRVFPENSIACLGVSAALPQDQLLLARNVASAIGIPLWEARTSEGNDPRYVENKGQSCYYCKTNLYTTLNQVAAHVKAQGSSPGVIPVMFNGTNADDKLDPTRLGLVAATEFQVVSPLEHLSKASVRQISKDLGLPNWNYAASPCLRSRLAFGVSANPDHLARIEKAEGEVRSSLALARTDNLRVRFLANNRAAVELDAEKERALLPTQIHHVETICRDLGFDHVVVRSFKSGSVSGYTPSSSSGP